MNSPYINPIAFEIGSISVYWYGVIIATSVFIGLFFATKEAKRRNFNEDTVLDLVLWALPFAIIGARIYYVIFEWEYYISNPSRIFATRTGGLAIHGGLIGAVIVALIFAKKRKVNFWDLADITAPGIVLGQAIGRWGNFMNQEAHGGSVSRTFLESLMLPQWIIEQMNIVGTYYHPTFLYESLWNFSIFLFLYLYWKKRDFLKRGEVFLTYIVLYSVGRFFIEGLRTDSLMMWGLRTAQVISIFLIIGAISLSYFKRKL
ncbi:prolipoprotein diacylglyceryl transferase [Halonatronum saccharophilum]|uniref:prolipoprotein diacylglyceryl transferase n=1 Tax=Halonatronum saccharophilum TaxID=150060 RepID=UPI000483780D|nr:prolipoprotein diacylglyceryl transferase [Halonatronum saccharophilum]